MKTLISLTISMLSLLSVNQKLAAQDKESFEQKLFENTAVRFTAKLTDCIIPSEGLYAEYMLIRLENKTDKTLEVSFYVDTYRNGTCTNCDHEAGDRKRTLLLKPFEILEGNCSPGLNVGLKAFSKWLQFKNDSYLSKIEVTDVETVLITSK